MTNKFTVNVKAERTGVEWTRGFAKQIQAEWYVRYIDTQTNYKVTEYNFVERFSDDQINAWHEEEERKSVAAAKAQQECLYITRANQIRPDIQPCEVCGKQHENYHCCERCNYDTHCCHFCGDNLGHAEVSACYILERWRD